MVNIETTLRPVGDATDEERAKAELSVPDPADEKAVASLLETCGFARSRELEEVGQTADRADEVRPC